MTAIIISILYAIGIILATMILIAYNKVLINYKYLIITLMGAYSLGKWLLLKVPTIKIMVGLSFGDSLLLGLVVFGFIVIPFFHYFEDVIKGKELSSSEKTNVFWLFIAFLLFHSVPEAIQVRYSHMFVGNQTIGLVIKSILEEIPEFIMLLALFVMVTSNKKMGLILGMLTGLLFPLTTLFVYIFVEQSNTALEMMLTNILLGFYITFGVMSFNILLKYNKKYTILFVSLLMLFGLYRFAIGL